MAWTDLSGAFGYGTKLTSNQQSQLRDNVTHVYNFCDTTGGSGGQILIKQGGANMAAKTISGGITINADGVVPLIGQGQLKTSQGYIETNNTSGLSFTVPGGQYGFFPQIAVSQEGNYVYWKGPSTDSATHQTRMRLWAAYEPHFCLIHIRYVTASGEVYWLFFLRDKATKKVIASYGAPDHPCFGNGGKPLLVSHPFPEFDPATQEIIVVNPSLAEVKSIERQCVVEDETKPDRKFLQVVREDYEIIESSRPAWPKKAVTVGLPPDCNHIIGENIMPVKKVIPEMEILHARVMRRKVEGKG